jgi:hypothetical protein
MGSKVEVLAALGEPRALSDLVASLGTRAEAVGGFWSSELRPRFGGATTTAASPLDFSAITPAP